MKGLATIITLSAITMMMILLASLTQSSELMHREVALELAKEKLAYEAESVLAKNLFRHLNVQYDNEQGLSKVEKHLKQVLSPDLAYQDEERQLAWQVTVKDLNAGYILQSFSQNEKNRWKKYFPEDMEDESIKELVDEFWSAGRFYISGGAGLVDDEDSRVVRAKPLKYREELFWIPEFADFMEMVVQGGYDERALLAEWGSYVSSLSPIVKSTKPSLFTADSQQLMTLANLDEDELVLWQQTRAALLAGETDLQDIDQNVYAKLKGSFSTNSSGLYNFIVKVEGAGLPVRLERHLGIDLRKGMSLNKAKQGFTIFKSR